MKKTIIAMAIAAGLSLAQGPGGPGGPGGPPLDPTELKAYLGLSDAQVTSLTEIGRQLMQTNQSSMEEMRTKRAAVKTLLDAGTTDAAAIGRAVLEEQSAQKRLEANRTSASAAAKNILTADQKTKLAALESASKLRPQIEQAVGLMLITPANDGAGAGPRMMRMPGRPVPPVGF